MRSLLLGLLSLFAVSTANHTLGVAPRISNQCVTFQVSSGTGCAWMCNYCANALGTYNYYFTTDVCKYQDTGCVGNPQANVPYTCCAA